MLISALANSRIDRLASPSSVPPYRRPSSTSSRSQIRRGALISSLPPHSQIHHALSPLLVFSWSCPLVGGDSPCRVRRAPTRLYASARETFPGCVLSGEESGWSPSLSELLMLDPRSEIYPAIEYRPIQPSDLEVLEKIHVALFPIRYEREFFLNVVNGHGIVSWGAVDTSRSDDRRDELIGFVTTRMIASKDSEIEDLFRYNSSWKDLTLVYILTLGVVDRYRKLGIASSLVQEVVKYAASISNCRGVYLHVISYNQPAISFYKKMLFKLVRRLPMFYYIRGQHYDSYLFVYYVNGGRSPCSPLPEPVHMRNPLDVGPLRRICLFENEYIREIVTSFVVYFRAFLKMLVAKFWSKEDKITSRWSRCKESAILLAAAQNNKRLIDTEDTRCHV